MFNRKYKVRIAGLESVNSHLDEEVRILITENESLRERISILQERYAGMSAQRNDLEKKLKFLEKPVKKITKKLKIK